NVQGENHPVGRGAGYPERVVIGVVDLAETGEEEHEGAREGYRVPTTADGDQRGDEPRGRDRKLVEGFELVNMEEVLPLDGANRFWNLPPHLLNPRLVARASRLELRPSTPMGERDNSRSLATAAGGDVPDGFNLGAAHGVDAIVQIDGGVAVRREELHELTEHGYAALLRHESAVLIARPRVFDTRPLDRLGDEGLVRRERLEAAVDHGHSRRGHAHHGGQHGQRHLEVVVVSSALAADAPVVEVHHAVGARLQLREPGEIAVDVESAGGAAAHDLRGQVVLLEQLARLH